MISSLVPIRAFIITAGGKSQPYQTRPPDLEPRPRVCAARQRLAGHEALVERRCPGALTELEQLRSQQARGQDWPAWCWLPSDVVDRVTGRHLRPELGDQLGLSLSKAAAFVDAWRQGKGIYRVSAEFEDELRATTLPGSLPCEVLLEFPEWCAYVALRPIPGVVGAYLRLDWEMGTGRPLLAMLFDFATGVRPENSLLVSLDLPLGHDDLSAALSELLTEGGQRRDEVGGEVATLAQVARPFVDVALYLCSVEADIVGDTGAGKPRRASGQVPGPRTWDVGYRVAALLRSPGGRHATGPWAGTQARAPPEARPLAYLHHREGLSC